MISSDSLSLIHALKNKTAYQNESGILLSDIERLFSDFPEASVHHVRRNFNTVAHNLAKQALLLDDESSYIEEN